MLHCIIFFCSTGCPPRSEKPSFTSSLANTVPKAAHQLTVLSFKYVKRYFKSSSCFSSSVMVAQSLGIKLLVSSSQTAFTSAEPAALNFSIKVLISSARSFSRLYQELNNCIKIHCVHL